MNGRIAFFGNIGNNFYQLGRSLRAHSDLDVHLLLSADADRIQRPESDDPDLLTQGYPDWIHVGAYGLSLKTVLMPWRAPVVNDLRQYDVAVVSGLGPVFAQFSGRPWCFLVTGGDLTVTPFPWRFRRSYSSLKVWAGLAVLSIWQRRGIRRADEIWAQTFSPNRNALARLRVEPQRESSEYFPFTLDTQTFVDGPVADPDNALLARMQAADLAVFHPSRLMIRDSPELRDSGQWKRNDVLLRGVAELVARRPEVDVVLVMPDRSESPDRTIARELCTSLGIEDHVIWAVPPRPDGFTRHELIDLYRASDVVVDEFGVGWFGMVVLEGLSIGRPVISWVDEEVLGRMYPWHPLVSVREAGPVADALERLLEPTHREELGRRGRSWVEQFHSPAATAPKYVEAIRGMAHRLVRKKQVATGGGG